MLSSCLLAAVLPIAAAPRPILTAAVAADLASLEQPLRSAFQKDTGIEVRFVLGASGMLARQVEQGAPYDLFLSANEQFVNDLAASGHLEPASVRTYALGRLGLWSRTGKVKSLADLRWPSILHIAIANPIHAPYGAAAREVLENQGFWRELQPKLVYGENVRQTLQYAETGNADAALTAWTLVFDRGGILIPAEWHKPIRQACGIVKGSPNADAARRFLDYLSGPKGRKILQDHGLFVPGPR